MKILIRALFGVAAVFVFALANQTPVQAQNRIEDRFANVNGVRLHYLIAGKGDPHSVPEADRRFYAAAYAQPGGMRAGFEVFRAFERDAQDFAQFEQTRSQHRPRLHNDGRCS